MKIMKTVKLLSLVLLTVISFSCSSNDEDGLSSNSIVGTWKPIKEVRVCSTGKEEVQNTSSCEQKSTYVFKKHTNQSLQTDGTITITVQREENGECKNTYNATGTWTIKDNSLTLTIDGDTDIKDFFELTSNRLRIGEYNHKDRFETCDGGNKPSHSYGEFNRVN